MKNSYLFYMWTPKKLFLPSVPRPKEIFLVLPLITINIHMREYPQKKILIWLGSLEPLNEMKCMR